MSDGYGGRRRPLPPPPPSPAPSQSIQSTPAVASQAGGPSHEVVVRSDEVLEPMSRPGFGRELGDLRKGRPLPGVKVNTFRVALSQPDSTWWKYEVVIATAARTKSDGTTVPSKPIPKSLLRKVWAELQHTHGDKLGGIQPAFDGGNAIYTNRQLPVCPLLIEDITLRDGKKGSFTIAIKNPIPIPLESLQAYISGQGQVHVGDVFESLQALNVLFRHTLALLFASTRTSFFPIGDIGSSVKLPKGVQLWRGFFQSIRASARGLQLNLDTTSGAYVQSGNLLQLILDFTGLRDPRMLDVSQGRLSSTTLLTINRLLRRVAVTVDRGRQVPAGKERYFKMQLRGGGLKFLSARNHRFDVDGQQTNVEDFFRTTYGSRLQYPDAPLLEIKPGVLVPIELVTVDPGHKWAHRLSPEQTALAARFQILEPGDRLRQILRMRQNLLQQGTHIGSFGVSVAVEETQVPARILDPPRIEYQSERPRDRRQGVPPRFVSARVADGGWKQNRRGPSVVEKLITPNKELKSAIVIMSREDMLRDGPNWFQSFFTWCAELGLLISPAVASARQGLFFSKNNHDVGTVVSNAIRQAENNFGQPPQMVFWLFDSESSADYDSFKYITLCRGIASQALVYSKISRKERDFSFHLNCALKFNVKLGGFNYRLQRNAPGRENFMQRQTPMVFGADLSHQVDKPSIAAITASMHEQGILHEEQITIQPLLEPSAAAPPTSRARKQEIIVHLEQMVFALLCRRVLSQPKCPPEAILFFRDGVSESEISQVLRTEVVSTRRAFERFRRTLLDRTSADHLELVESIMSKRGMPEDQKQARLNQFMQSLQAWKPKLTFILTIKRQHIRAFASTGPQNASNIPPGTVIDSDVVDARVHDFYLASHKGIKGTTRPARYLLLADDNNLTPDDIQELVNDTTHMFQRCNRAVSLPASVYYADVICQRVRGWLNAGGNNYDATTEHSGGTRDQTAATRQQELEACRLTLESTELGRNMFRAKGGPPAMWWL